MRPHHDGLIWPCRPISVGADLGIAGAGLDLASVQGQYQTSTEDSTVRTCIKISANLTPAVVVSMYVYKDNCFRSSSPPFGYRLPPLSC
jgi:hypothetical protein